MRFMKRFGDKFLYGYFIRFFLVGGAALSCSLAGFYLLVDQAGISYLSATALLFFVVNFFSFLLNKYFTFRTESIHLPREMGRYYAIMASSFVLNLISMFLLVDVFGVWYIAASVITAFLMMWYNFCWSYFWGFGKGI